MGKGLGSSAVPPHAGISCDLRQLYQKYKEMGSVRLRDFAEVFRSLGMNTIWYGRQSSAELIEFSERLLQVSATRMCSTRVSSTDPGMVHEHSLQERIFGVYACYTFFLLQPQDYVCRIRITPDEMREVRELWQTVLVPKRHLDAAACIFKLIDADAFKIVPFKLCFDPVCHKRYDVPDCDDDIGDDEEPPFSAASALLFDPLLKQISLLHEKYEEGKEKFKGLRPHKDIYLELNETVHAVKMEAKDEQTRKEARIQEDIGWNENEGNRGTSSKSRIKDNAYKANIKHSRNRRYVDPEMHKGGDPNENNEKKTPRKRKNPRLAIQYEEDEIEEVQVVAETPKQPRAKKAKLASPKMTLAMKEQHLAIEKRDNLLPVADESYQKILNEFKDSAETRAVEDEMSQLLSEAGAKSMRSAKQQPKDF